MERVLEEMRFPILELSESNRLRKIFFKNSQVDYEKEEKQSWYNKMFRTEPFI